MHVIGTAGHVDHGKSTLVQALTGIDPDRLKEEKARGMTIDLGFAWIELPVIESHEGPSSQEKKHHSQTQATESVGIVDVPGHIDFIKNMLAGVGSIDAAVLVIAADESVMPQTREHLAILDLLAVPAGVVALTKTDLIDDPEWLDLVELDIVELLQDTRLADIPIVRVSATTGEGLDELRHALAVTLGKLPQRRNRARPRLPVDRIFSLSGFGTIVTGTLSDGMFTVGDVVEVLPRGLSARVRGLQTHKKQVWQSQPGSRLAMNLSGISIDQIRRGDVIVKPDTLRNTILVDASFQLLADASKPLKHNQAVDFFCGAAEIPARVRVLGTEALEPGQEGWLQLRLDRPAVVTAGDRYILRQPSPSITLGGGVVLSPHPRRRWRRFDPSVITRLETLAKGTPDEILLQTLSRQLYLSTSALLGQSGLDLELAQEALTELLKSGAVVSLNVGKEPALLSVGAWNQLLTHLQKLLDTFHDESPLRRGILRSEARSRLQGEYGGIQLSVRFFNEAITQAQAVEIVDADDSYIWRKGYAIALTLHEQAMVDNLLSTYADAKFSPPNAPDTLRMLDQNEELLESLVEQNRLVRISGGVLFRTEEFETMLDKIRQFANEQGSITLAQVRDLLQTSRKYAQAVLEEMDARRITRREGDVRVLR